MFARTRLLVVAVATASSLGALGFTWHRNNQAVEEVEAQLTTVIRGVNIKNFDSGVGELARERSDDIQARMGELSQRLFVNEERLKTLQMRIDWFEARLNHAEVLVKFEQCNAQIAGYTAEVERTLSECAGAHTEYARCKADFESARSKGTATAAAGCGLMAMLFAGATGGLGAGAIALCGGATLAAHTLPEDKCGTESTCSMDREEVTSIVLASHELTAMPVCTAPGNPPAATFEEYLAWHSQQNTVASL